MAIIKEVKYNGFTPYWWEVKEAREDRINNITNAILCLFADPSIPSLNPNGYIQGHFPTIQVEGLGLTNNQIISSFLSQNINNPDWKWSVDTNAISYSIQNINSPIIQQISNDPITKVIRFVTIVDYRHFCENNIVLLNMRITFDTINTSPAVYTNNTTQIIGSNGLPEVDSIGNPVYGIEGQPILNTQGIQETINIINTDPSKFIIDSSKTQMITWIVDDSAVIPGTTTGEATYFISQVPSSFWSILNSGITYADQQGYINDRLIS